MDKLAMSYMYPFVNQCCAQSYNESKSLSWIRSWYQKNVKISLAIFLCLIYLGIIKSYLDERSISVHCPELATPLARPHTRLMARDISFSNII